MAARAMAMHAALARTAGAARDLQAAHRPALQCHDHADPQLHALLQRFCTHIDIRLVKGEGIHQLSALGSQMDQFDADRPGKDSKAVTTSLSSWD